MQFQAKNEAKMKELKSIENKHQMCKYEILTTTRNRTTTQIPLTIEQLQLTCIT